MITSGRNWMDWEGVMINPETEPDRQYTAREVAQYFRVHYKTVLTWIDEGRLEASRPEQRYLITGHAINDKIRRGRRIVY